MSVIILEGIDGSGKTTLARWLEKEKGFKYHHEGVPSSEVDLFQYYAALLWKGLHQKPGAVFDRFHLGERVYGSVVRGVDRIGNAGMFLFQRVLNSQPITLAVCDPGLTAAQDNWRAKVKIKDDYIVEKRDFFMAQSMFFDCYYRFSGLARYHNNIIWDYSVTGTNDSLWEWHEGNKGSCPEGVIGNDPARAKFLLVGEQVNHDKMEFPFFALDGSSKFLNDSLWQAGFQESEMTFTNAKTYKGKERDLEKVLKLLPNIRGVIALGAVAYKACKRSNLPGTRLYQIEHPSYFKRFRTKDIVTYPKYLQLIRDEVLAWK